MQNPWTELTAEEAAQYINFAVPEGAENVVYRLMEAEGQEPLAEVQFDLDGRSFNMRVQRGVDADVDISGMYYDWTATNDTWKVQHCDARTMSYISKTEDDAMVTLWYDAAPGLMYSLSAAGNDLNGLDLPVLADQIYIPTQGNAG